MGRWVVFRPSRMIPWLLAAGVCAAVLAVAERPVATHPRITTTLLWAKDIAPILQRRCFSCHSQDNVAMPLVTFSEARPWAAAIREEVLLRHMPPWSAAPGFGRFRNDPSLTQGEWDLLVAWVDGGSPSGMTLAEEQQPTVFVSPTPTWEHGEPDAIVKPPSEHAVAAGAADHVQRFEIPTGFSKEQRVHGLAFKPGDRRVVRYASVYEAGTNRWLFTWTPWSTSMHLPEGVAYAIKAGATLSVEIGYRGTEEATADASEIGFYFDDAASGGVAATQTLETSSTSIAAGSAPTRIRGELTLDQQSAVYAVWPETSPGTVSLELTAFLADGSVKPLLWLRDYRADFPSPYVYADPVTLPAGTRLVMNTYITGGDTAVTAQPRLQLVRVPASAGTF